MHLGKSMILWQSLMWRMSFFANWAESVSHARFEAAFLLAISFTHTQTTCAQVKFMCFRAGGTTGCAKADGPDRRSVDSVAHPDGCDFHGLSRGYRCDVHPRLRHLPALPESKWIPATFVGFHLALCVQTSSLTFKTETNNFFSDSLLPIEVSPLIFESFAQFCIFCDKLAQSGFNLFQQISTAAIPKSPWRQQLYSVRQIARQKGQPQGQMWLHQHDVLSKLHQGWRVNSFSVLGEQPLNGTLWEEKLSERNKMQRETFISKVFSGLLWCFSI